MTRISLVHGIHARFSKEIRSIGGERRAWNSWKICKKSFKFKLLALASTYFNAFWNFAAWAAWGSRSCRIEYELKRLLQRDTTKQSFSCRSWSFFWKNTHMNRAQLRIQLTFNKYVCNLYNYFKQSASTTRWTRYQVIIEVCIDLMRLVPCSLFRSN